MIVFKVIGTVALTALSGAYLGLMMWQASHGDGLLAMANGAATATFALGAFKMNQIGR